MTKKRPRRLVHGDKPGLPPLASPGSGERFRERLYVASGVRSFWSPVNGTENSSFSEALQLVPPGKDADFDPNQSPDCVEIMRPSSMPNAGRRLSRKTLAVCPAPFALLTDILQCSSIC